MATDGSVLLIKKTDSLMKTKQNKTKKASVLQKKVNQITPSQLIDHQKANDC